MKSGLWLTFVLVVWLMTDVSWATHQMFADVTRVTLPAATAYASLLGLPAVFVGFFEWVRRKHHAGVDPGQS